MKKIIGILLILFALGTGYKGITTISNSGESLEVLGVELSASDNNQKTTGFAYLGFAVLALLGGVTLLNSKS